MSAWKGQSKGSPLGYRIFIWILNTLGLSSAYVLSKIVARYYYFTAKESKNALHDFYSQLGYAVAKDRNRLIYKNFCLMAEVLIDKIAFSKGGKNNLEYTEDGEHNIADLLEQGKGVFLVGGHVGSWDMAAQFLDIGTTVNVVMYQNEKEQIEEAIGDRKNNFNIIPLTEDIGFVIAISQAIKRNEIICFNVDRTLTDSNTTSLDFLGRTASFPTGVYKLAHKLKSPVAFISGVKTSKSNYHFTCKPLGSVSDNEQSVNELATQFKDCFEQITKQYPEQWFNHFKFWENNKLA